METGVVGLAGIGRAKEVADAKVKVVEPAVLPKFDDKDKIDIFAKEMYLSSPKIDALQHVLSEEAGRDAFMKFLRTEYAAENLDFFIAHSSIKAIIRARELTFRSANWNTPSVSARFKRS